MNIAPAIRSALISDESITDGLSVFNGEPSVHTRRPFPDNVEYPSIGVSPDIVFVDRDLINSKKNFVVRDITVYGQQPGQYRDVEQLGYAVRELFHRRRFTISLPGYKVISVVATGPVPAPTDDQNLVARVVSLSIYIQPTS